MNREQMKPLNTNDGWEEIVNTNAMQKASAREREANKKRERKLRKLWLWFCGCAVICVTFLILGMTGAAAEWFASVVIALSAMAGCFLLGRFVEVKKS